MKNYKTLREFIEDKEMELHYRAFDLQESKDAEKLLNNLDEQRYYLTWLAREIKLPVEFLDEFVNSSEIIKQDGKIVIVVAAPF
ncbi:MAG: hypothetical protein PWQ45_134 [Thermosipho sp. (in: thermotogales)]|jgi:hypothetical protein|nr:hypothetical protein [Thermosipho sp. (in: thermotogales)]